MNDFTTAIALTTALVLAFVAHEARAQSTEIPDRGPVPFSAFDRNGDGVITEDEFDAVKAERMEKRAAEGRPMRGAGGAPTFAELDADGDGKITPEELAAGQARQREKRGAMGMGQGQGAGQGMGPGRDRPTFEDFDLDGDGSISEAEFVEFRNKRISERVAQGYQMRGLSEAPTFEELDLDGDGKLSREEFEAHQAERRRSNQP